MNAPTGAWTTPFKDTIQLFAEPGITALPPTNKLYVAVADVVIVSQS